MVNVRIVFVWIFVFFVWFIELVIYNAVVLPQEIILAEIYASGGVPLNPLQSVLYYTKWGFILVALGAGIYAVMYSLRREYDVMGY